MRRSVGTSGRGNMRPGLISLLTVVVIISLATAAVLTVSTSHAMHALSQRQATMTAESYAAERSGQKFLSLVAEELASARAAGQTSQAEALDLVANRANSLLVEACQEGVSAGFELQNDAITCTFTTEGGRMLQVQISIGEGAAYDVTSWKLTAAPMEEDTGDTLWLGPTAEE